MGSNFSILSPVIAYYFPFPLFQQIVMLTLSVYPCCKCRVLDIAFWYPTLQSPLPVLYAASSESLEPQVIITVSSMHLSGTNCFGIDQCFVDWASD